MPSTQGVSPDELFETMPKEPHPSPSYAVATFRRFWLTAAEVKPHLWPLFSKEVSNKAHCVADRAVPQSLTGQ